MDVISYRIEQVHFWPILTIEQYVHSQRPRKLNSRSLCSQVSVDFQAFYRVQIYSISLILVYFWLTMKRMQNFCMARK